MHICFVLRMTRATDLQPPRGQDRRSVETQLALTQFSTRLPIELLVRLRIAAPQLGMTQSSITTKALHAFLTREGL